VSGNEPQYPDPSAEEARQEVLDFLITQEYLGVTFVTAAIENAPGTPSEAFLPVYCATW